MPSRAAYHDPQVAKNHEAVMRVPRSAGSLYRGLTRAALWATSLARSLRAPRFVHRPGPVQQEMGERDGTATNVGTRNLRFEDCSDGEYGAR